MPLRVLVVEDEASNMQILAMTLALRGYEVIEAQDPEHGLVLAREACPDVILMDLMFKGAAFDGIEAIRRLKADPLTAAVPVIAQTASVLLFAAAEVRAAGACELLQKPFRRGELIDAIRAAIPGCPEPLPRLREERDGAGRHNRPTAGGLT